MKFSDTIVQKAGTALQAALRRLGPDADTRAVEDLALDLMDLTVEELEKYGPEPEIVMTFGLEWEKGLGNALPKAANALKKAVKAVAGGIPWLNVAWDVRAGACARGPFIEIKLFPDLSVEASVDGKVLRVRPVLHRLRGAGDNVTSVEAGLDDAGIIGALSEVVGRCPSLSGYPFFARSPGKETSLPTLEGKSLLVAPDDVVWFNPTETSVLVDGEDAWRPLADPSDVRRLADWKWVKRTLVPPPGKEGQSTRT